VLLPSLVQNIAGSSGGFCFPGRRHLPGFLHQRFIRAWWYSAALFAFTLALLWGGYQFASAGTGPGSRQHVLLTLRILLLPLNLSVLARLLATAVPAGC